MKASKELVKGVGTHLYVAVADGSGDFVEVDVGVESCNVAVGGMGVMDAGGGRLGSWVEVGGGISVVEVQVVRKAARISKNQTSVNPISRLKWSVPVNI